MGLGHIASLALKFSSWDLNEALKFALVFSSYNCFCLLDNHFLLSLMVFIFSRYTLEHG